MAAIPLKTGSVTRPRARLVLPLLAGAVTWPAASAAADAGGRAIELHAQASLDLVGVTRGGGGHGLEPVGVLDVSADVDLGRALDWPAPDRQGARAHVDFLANAGGQPNTLAATLQGIDNLEVTGQGVRLYQVWIETSLPGGGGEVRVGFSDLNSDFYATDAACLLMGPAFGMGPELSRTGSLGASTYPSSALGVRWRVRPSAQTYGEIAVVNARAGVLGDPGGPDFSFRDGVLTVTEAGWAGEGKVKVAIGAWAYSRAPGAAAGHGEPADPVQRPARGAYAMAEAPLRAGVRAFIRGGFAGAGGTELAGAWQAGLRLEPAISSRPNSSASFGVSQALLPSSAIARGHDLGPPLAPTETEVEATYAEKLTPHLSIQPDIQYIHRPSGRRDVKDAAVFSLRLTAVL
ncbi:MAG TPA: carbohydrate porin [Caulobacteraceae bacterium]